MIYLNPDFLMHFQYRYDYAKLIKIQSRQSGYIKAVNIKKTNKNDSYTSKAKVKTFARRTRKK